LLKKSWINRGTVLIRVGAHHIAFLRGYFEGLELAALSSRYLETATAPDPDLRIAKSTLKWVREQLLVLARRSGRFGDARLLMIEPERLRAVRRGHLPTLEQFREDRDPYEMYTESELIALFEEKFGADGGQIDRRVARDERLRRKQLAALAALEQSIDARPALCDPVAGWIDPALARRLAAAGIVTLHDLVRIINGKGYRWWVGVARFGEKAAAQVVAWLKTEPVEKSLGIPLGPQASIKARQIPPALLERNRERVVGIVPFEFLLVPAELDGSAGENRGECCEIRARNDYDAVREWLNLKPAESNTWRSYRKEAERFLLWAIVERRRPLSSLSSDDCTAYRDFLRRLDPGKAGEWPFRLPRDAWFGKRGARRWSDLWRPFEGPLSEESQRLALTIVDSMCRWLTNRRYLDSNPWDGVPLRMSVAQKVTQEVVQKVDTARSFTALEWNWLMDFLARMGDEAKRARLRFVLAFGYATGLRLSEMVNARIGDLERMRDAGDALSDRWVLNVVGKGRRHRQVPFPSSVFSELDGYLRQRGLGDRLSCDPGVHLIGRLRGNSEQDAAAFENGTVSPSPKRRDGVARELGGKDAISGELLYKLLKKFFGDAADAIRRLAEQPVNAPGTPGRAGRADLDEIARHLRRASTHWLRHTYNNHAVAGRVKLETAQHKFRRASINTTSIYTRPDTAQCVDEREDIPPSAKVTI
jgi:site-specific recombinase XerD